MARIAIISDIHSNLAALEAVVKHAGTVDGWWCTGDIVGYGPQPNECIAKLLELDVRCIMGNHDHGVLNLSEIPWFNSTAGDALVWTETQLTPDSREFLTNLPTTRVEGGFELVHGSPRQPLTEYVMSADIAEQSFRRMTEPVCFIGHTHVPSSFAELPDRQETTAVHQLPETGQNLDAFPRMILNAGSVGQPRDGDPRAAYGFLDTAARTFTWRRVEYDVQRTQDLMRRAHLPIPLIERLSEGW